MPNEKMSFVPKKKYTAVEKQVVKKKQLGLFLKIAILLFVLSLVFFGGVFGYKKVIVQQLDDLFISMERAKASFDPEFILELDELSADVVVVGNLVTAHRYPSRIFSFLEEVTLDGLRFDNFGYSYTTAEESSPAVSLTGGGQEVLKVNLKGEARDYTVLAQQAEVLKKSSLLGSYSFSNFLLNQEGNVDFDLQLIFKKSIYD